MSKTRLANKTIWTLEDIIAASYVARRAWRNAHARAKQQMDPIMLAALSEIIHQLAEIEGLARDGRQGRYRERSVDE